MSSVDARQEAVDGILASDLVSLSPQEREPFSVVDRLIVSDTTSKHLHCYLLKPSTSQLTVEALQAQLGPSVRQFLNLPQEAFFLGELLFEMLEQLTVHGRTLTEVVNAPD